MEERKADDESTAAAADDDSNEVRWQKKKSKTELMRFCISIRFVVHLH